MIQVAIVRCECLDAAANSSYSQCDLLNSAAMALNEYRDCRQLMSLAGCLRQFERGSERWRLRFRHSRPAK